jgi:hypothetical protein
VGRQAISNVPFQRNPFFKGREKIFADLDEALMRKGSAAIASAISGLGGIGKTQTAVEYTYRHRERYNAIFWVRAETQPELAAGYTEIATLLDLPEKRGQQDAIVRAVRRWLETNDASRVAEELGYLPLALEQAAAYIEDGGTSFQSYLGGYRKRRLQLLGEDTAPDEHPAVTATWQMNFDAVAEMSQVSADVLAASAFMAPDSIPRELIEDGARALGPNIARALAWSGRDALTFDEMLKPLTRFSLIKRDVEERTFSVHRLVQEAVRARMDAETQKTWAERVVAAATVVFPEVDFTNWARCSRLLVQCKQVMNLVNIWHIESATSAKLFLRVGWYLRERGDHVESETFLHRCHEICQRIGDRRLLATCLNEISSLALAQGDTLFAVSFRGKGLAQSVLCSRALGPPTSPRDSCRATKLRRGRRRGRTGGRPKPPPSIAFPV